MLMRLCCSALVPLCGFCPAVAARFLLMFSRDVLNLLWYFTLWDLVLVDVQMGPVTMRMLACESLSHQDSHMVCKDRQQQPVATA